MCFLLIRNLKSQEVHMLIVGFVLKLQTIYVI